MKYILDGPRNLNLAEMVLVGDPHSGPPNIPQRRPVVLSLEEHKCLTFGGTISREIDRTIELLTLGPKERKRRLKILRGLRRKLLRI